MGSWSRIGASNNVVELVVRPDCGHFQDYNQIWWCNKLKRTMQSFSREWESSLQPFIILHLNSNLLRLQLLTICFWCKVHVPQSNTRMMKLPIMNGIWLGVNLRMDITKSNMCLKKIALHTQNTLTILGSMINILGGANIWLYKEHKNVRFDHE